MRRSNLPKPSAFEKGLAFIAPAFARKVYGARVAFAMADTYHGASKTRRAVAGWSTGGGDADADTLPYLEDLRERSRDLVRNSAVGGAAIVTKTTAVVGTGLTLQANVNRDTLKARIGLTDEQLDEWERTTEAEFKLWGKCPDIEDKLTIYEIQELAFRSVLENGDLLITTPYKLRPKQAYGLKIQMIEADRVCNRDNTADTETKSGGVNRDSDGATISFDVLTTHPGRRFHSVRKWTTVKANGADGRRNAWLLFHKVRIGQTRGIPDLAPVIEVIKQLSNYTDSTALSAVIQSLFTVFIETPDSESLDLPTEKNFDQEMGHGNIVELNEGEKVQFAAPSQPGGNFDPFVMALTRQIGARLEIPFEVLMKHFTASYSASRAALIEAWRYFMGRREWLANNLCLPLYELFLTEAVFLGRISAPGFLNGDPIIREAWLGADWVGDAPGQIDEGKAVDAAKKRIDAGFSNEAIETTALTGRDWDNVYRQRKKEIETRRNDDMLFTPDAPPDPALEPKIDDEE